MRVLLITGVLLSVIFAIVSCDEQQIEYSRYYSAGAVVYQSHCQNCHGDKGQGLAALIPPLTDSLYLKQNKHLLSCYLQNGLTGKIQVDKRTFDGSMPAATLSNIEIAQVLTYVNNSFGNKNWLFDAQAIKKDLSECK